MMMQPAQHRSAKNVTEGSNGTWHRRILIEGQMGAHLMVVILHQQDMTKVLLARQAAMDEGTPHFVTAAVQSAARYMPDAIKQDASYKDVADLLRPLREPTWADVRQAVSRALKKHHVEVP